MSHPTPDRNLVYSYAFCKYVHIAQTLQYTIGLHVSLDICLQNVLLLPSRSISHLWLCTMTKKEGRIVHLDGVSTTITYVRANARFKITMRFCKSRKTTLVKLVKRFNAKQIQKCLFDCLLLASFSVVISLCTVTKEEEKTRNVNVYLLINSIACNELTTACRV